MKKIFKKLKGKIKQVQAFLFDLELAENLLFLFGALAVSAGVYDIYPPAGKIAAGVLAVLASYLINRARKEKDNSKKKQ